MKTTTQNTLHAALMNGPKTQEQLVALTGLSKPTVIRALSKLGIGWLANTWPRQYALGDDVPALPVAVDGLVVARRPLPPMGWPKRWNGARVEFAGTLGAMEITPDSDPKGVADDFERAASTLASIAEALRTVTGKPDWWVILDGETGPENVTAIDTKKSRKKVVDKPKST